MTARRHDPPATARVKSDLRMVQVLRRAVADRQRVPREDLHLPYDNLDLVLDRATCQRAREAGRRSSRPHNPARETVERILLMSLVDQVRAGPDRAAGLRARARRARRGLGRAAPVPRLPLRHGAHLAAAVRP